MRIAVWHNLPSGGGKRALYNHVRGLLKRGHFIESWCPPTADQGFLPLKELVAEHVVPLDWDPGPPRGALDRAYRSLRGIRPALAAMDRHCRECCEQITAGGFDVLLAAGCKLLGVSPVGRHARIPSSLYLQETRRGFHEARPLPQWLGIAPPETVSAVLTYLPRFAANLVRLQRTRAQVRAEIDNANAFDKILVNSYFSRENVLGTYGLDAEVCYLGVDTDFFRRTAQPRDHIVVGLGELAPHKNVGLIIQSVALLPEPRPQLLWLGNRADSSYLREMVVLAKSLNVDFRPKVLVSDQELLDSLNRARVLAYAPRLEPFGLAPLEANACELPVVATSEGGVRETIVDDVNGLLVDHNLVSLSKALARVLADPELAHTLGRNGRRVVEERWSLDAAADRLESHVDKLLVSVAEVPVASSSRTGAH